MYLKFTTLSWVTAGHTEKGLSAVSVMRHSGEALRCRYCGELLNPWVDLARWTQEQREEVQVGVQVSAFKDLHLQNGKQICLFLFKRIAVCVRVKKEMQYFEEVGSPRTYFSVCMLGWVYRCQLCCRKRLFLINHFIASKPKYSVTWVRRESR